MFKLPVSRLGVHLGAVNLCLLSRVLTKLTLTDSTSFLNVSVKGRLLRGTYSSIFAEVARFPDVFGLGILSLIS